MLDKRKKVTHQVTKLAIFIAALLLGALLNELAHYESWESKQLKLGHGYGIVSPLPDFYTYAADVEITQPEATKSAEVDVSIIVQGKASYYSYNGCLGCNEKRRMANGEILDDSIKTIALPVEEFATHRNSMVYVANLDNKQGTLCKVTDTGGFTKYNRVADLNVACAEAIGLKTDISNIVVYK